MAGKLRHAGREGEIGARARGQHGVLARWQLREMGVPSRTIERWASCGRLRPIHRDVFAVGHMPPSQRARWLAAVLACGNGALLSHGSAAALWGLARSRGSRADVTAARGRQGNPARDRIRLHRGKIDREDRASQAGIPVTTVARTLFDLAEVVAFSQLEAAWEEADRLNLLRLAALERVCERGYGRHALRPIRRLLSEARAAEATRSPLESRFAAFRRKQRLPPAATNVDVLGHEVDVLWPAARLVIELDSWEHHGHRAAFERDRARDPKLLLAGYRTIRVTHRRLDREPEQLAAEIRQLLSRPVEVAPAGG
jgi:very-short-patch-repair endonuclease